MEYKYKWYIPDAYLHSRGTGYFTSHEGCAFINETDRDAHVRFTFYFQDREAGKQRVDQGKTIFVIEWPVASFILK